MSSNTKDPLQQQDTPSESSESHSDSEVNETEENLEHLKIQEETRDDSEESKHSGSPDQKGVLASKNDPLDEPIAGPSGLQELHLDILPCSSGLKSKFANIADPQKENDLKTEDINLNIGEIMLEGESNTTKDLLQGQETPESSYSQSENEVSKAEENLEHLKIEEHPTKDDSDESKLLDNLKHGVLTSEDDIFREPNAVLSGLQEPHLESSCSNSDSKLMDMDKSVGERIVKDSDTTCGTPTFIQSSTGAISSYLFDDYEEKDLKAKDNDGNIAAKLEKKDSDTTGRSSTFIQSATGIAPSMLDEKLIIASPSSQEGKADHSELSENVAAHLIRKSPRSRRLDYASDSANTSSDVSEIQSEVVDTSAKASVCPEEPQLLEKEKPPSYAPAVERQISESSDANISELQDEIFPPPQSSSVPTSISGEQDPQAYLAPLQDACGIPVSTSSGEIGFYKHNVDDPNLDVSDHGNVPQSTFKFMEDDPDLRDQQIQVSDRLFQQERINLENRGKTNVPEDAMMGCVPRRKQVEERFQECATAGSPSKRRKQSVESCQEQMGTTEKQRTRFKPITGKKSKTIPSKSSPALQSSSGSTESKSSSSKVSHFKESLELESLSDNKEFPKFEKGKKSWQKSGMLRGMQTSAMTSTDSSIAEEQNVTSLEGKDPELMETNEPISEKTEKTSEKRNIEGGKKTRPSKSRLSIESSEQAYGFQTEETSRKHEQSFDVSDFKRCVGKSKREPKLSNSPPSDEIPSSSQPKAAKSRPKKKTKSEKIRRTRHDKADPFPENMQKSESVSTPDFSDYSGSEAETAF